MTPTPNEIDVLNGIAYAEMSPANGGKPESIDDTGTWCWADAFSATLSTNAVKGVLGSLAKKGLIIVADHGPSETVVNFTSRGFKVWQDNDDNRRAA
jgi:hypothetical protein